MVLTALADFLICLAEMGPFSMAMNFKLKDANSFRRTWLVKVPFLASTAISDKDVVHALASISGFSIGGLSLECCAGASEPPGIGEAGGVPLPEPLGEPLREPPSKPPKKSLAAAPFSWSRSALAKPPSRLSDEELCAGELWPPAGSCVDGPASFLMVWVGCYMVK